MSTYFTLHVHIFLLQITGNIVFSKMEWVKLAMDLVFMDKILKNKQWAHCDVSVDNVLIRFEGGELPVIL